MGGLAKSLYSGLLSNWSVVGIELNYYHVVDITLAAAQSADVRANPDRMEQHIKALAEFGANPEGGVSRVAFSEADLAGRAFIMDLMREACSP